MAQKSRILLIRHGETTMNRSGVLQGRSDLPLNEAGKAQAVRAGSWLAENGYVFDHVYSSPLIRAKGTAQLMTSAALTVDERLIEMDYGPYEGADLRHPSKELLAFFRDFVHHPAPEGMEQLSSVVERSGRFMEDIRHQEGTILISTHAIAMKGILEYLTPDSHGSYWNTYVGNCEIYHLECVDGVYSVPLPLVRFPKEAH